MSVRIHPTALVDPDARLGEDVEVGPFAIVGPNCQIGDGSVVAARATLEGNVTLGRGVRVGSGSILGGEPQDVKFKGEVTTVEIGDRSILREYVTVNRGSAASNTTTMGADCFIMSYSHLAHDCRVGDGVIFANGVQLAGHVTVEDRAIISGLSAVHQFVRIGRHAFIGGCSRVVQDVPPYLKAVGNPVRLYGLNSVGLQRSGFPPEVTRELKRAYRLLFRSDLNVSQALARARGELPEMEEMTYFLQFIEDSQRGIGF
jgi:UDP-N-acetylglucosamine acyltransferase